MQIERRTSGLKIGYAKADSAYYWEKVRRERNMWFAVMVGVWVI